MVVFFLWLRILNLRIQLWMHSEHIYKEIVMNEDIIKGKWKQLKGNMKKQWADLTDDDLQYAEGSHDYLVGRVQERYGRSKDEAKREVDKFVRDLPPEYR